MVKKIFNINEVKFRMSPNFLYKNLSGKRVHGKNAASRQEINTFYSIILKILCVSLGGRGIRYYIWTNLFNNFFSGLLIKIGIK